MMNLLDLVYDCRLRADDIADTGTEMNRRESLATTNLTAGNVQGGLANSALSALNSIVSLAVQEEV